MRGAGISALSAAVPSRMRAGRSGSVTRRFFRMISSIWERRSL